MKDDKIGTASPQFRVHSSEFIVTTSEQGNSELGTQLSPTEINSELRTLNSELAKRTLCLDGAMGTMIPRGKGLGDLLCLSEPEIIRHIHEQYLEAGADIITTCTFNAQRISLSDYHSEALVRDINLAAARLARQAAEKYSTPEKPRFVVGSVGPTNKSCSIAPDVENPALRSITFDELADAYREQMEALIEGGVDALLLETVFDTLNAKAAIYAAEEAMQQTGVQVPIMLSATISDNAGRMLTGQTIEAFLISVAHAPLLSVGFNCSSGAHDMLPNLRTLVAHASCYISAYPNAGLPNAMGEYDQSPQMMLEEMRPFVAEGLVNIIGGCCGTTPQHIKELAMLANSSSECKVQSSELLRQSGEWLRHSSACKVQSSECIVQCAPCMDAPIYSRVHQCTAHNAPDTLRSTPSQSNSEPWRSNSELRTLNSELAKPRGLCLSGLEPLVLTPEVGFVNVGERCNVAGSRKFLRLISEKNYTEALSIARRQVEDGAMVIDINMDDGLLDARQEMVTFLNLLMSDPDIARVPVMLDSSDWDVVVAGLKCLQGKAVVNSISLKEGEETFLRHARELRRFGAAAVVMLFDEEGQATSYERRTAVCERAIRLLTDEVGFPQEDIIIDPNILAICTGMPEHDDYAADFIRTIDWIRAHYPLVHISGGVSNLSFAFRGNNYLREAMHAVFLYHARKHGMDMAIMNPASKVMYSDIPEDLLQMLEDVILHPTVEARERLVAAAMQMVTEQGTKPDTKAHNAQSSGKPSTGHDSPEHKPVGERLVAALRRGITDNLETDLDEALQTYPTAVDIIEGPLMQGMNLVGQLFGEGKMFLPQVVKTARTMKMAVDYLQPYIQQQKTKANYKAGRVLLATVKGDVHDIGKNIVGVVMACNGYEIIDMGVMVPAEDIVSRALEVRPDVIGLSGLITPSLEEMVRTVALLRQAGINVPIMIGGATTSALHTALRIAPAYEGPVVWVRDASQNAPLAARFLSETSKAEALASLREEQESLRQSAGVSEDVPLSLEEARRRKLKLFES